MRAHYLMCNIQRNTRPQALYGTVTTFDWTALAAVAATASTAVAAAYTYLTHRLVRLNTDPKVLVYTVNDRERPGILMIVIENIGRDIAEGVRFTTDRPVPSRAFGMTIEEAQPSELMRSGPLIDGIPALGPGDTRRITWGQFGGLRKALGGKPIRITVEYRRGRHRFSSSSVLEVDSYEGTDASRTVLEEIASNLNTIGQRLQVLTGSIRAEARPSNARSIPDNPEPR